MPADSAEGRQRVHGRDGGRRDPDTSRVAIVAASVVPFVGFYQGLASFSLGPSWQQRLGLDAAGVSAIWVAYVVGVVVSLFLSPTIAGRVGSRPVLAAGLGIGVVASVVLALSDDATSTTLGRFLSGVTTGVSASVGVAAVLSLGADIRARFAVSVVTAACSLGPAVGAIGSGAVGTLSDPPDRAVYLVAMALVAAALAVVRLADPRGSLPDRGGPASPDASRRGRVVAVAVVQAVCGSAPIGYFFAMGALLFAAVLGTDDSAVLGTLAGPMFAGGLVGQVLAARTAQRVRRGVGLTLNVVSCVLVVAAMAAGSPDLLVAAGLSAGLGSGYAQLIVNASLQASLSGARLARALSWTHLAGYATNGALPLVLGRVSDSTGDYVLSSLLLAVTVACLAFLTGVLAIGLRRS